MYRGNSDRRLEVFGRINVLVNLPSRPSVYWYSRGMACLGSPSIAPRLGASDVRPRGHRPGLNKTWKNTAGRN